MTSAALRQDEHEAPVAATARAAEVDRLYADPAAADVVMTVRPEPR